MPSSTTARQLIFASCKCAPLATFSTMPEGQPSLLRAIQTTAPISAPLTDARAPVAPITPAEALVFPETATGRTKSCEDSEPMNQDILLFSGTANPALAAAVAAKLGVRLGRCAATRFPDGETEVRIDESVRGREVFLVQPTAPPVNDHEMMLTAV